MNKLPIRIVTIIQARIGSTRLPGKVLLPLSGKPLLLHMVNRVQQSKYCGKIVVATTTSPLDDPIEKLCEKEGISCYRGHSTDLLDRHFKAGIKYGADAVVKIPSDVPLIDPDVIDRVLQVYLSKSKTIDYVSNLHPPTYPDGNDVEVISMVALEKAWFEALQPFEREHTTPYIWEKPDQFRLANVLWETGLDYSMSHRWTIDYPEDYAFIKKVFNNLYSKNKFFSLNDILGLLESNPGLKTINDRYCGVNWYRHHLDKLKTIDSDKTRIEPEFINIPPANSLVGSLGKKQQ
jgi:spore coat polysaccharide biosynthesis protein SpsF